MTRSRRVLWAFPRSWRARYGAELESLLSDAGSEQPDRRIRDGLNVISAGLSARAGRHPGAYVGAGSALVAVVATIGLFFSGTFGAPPVSGPSGRPHIVTPAAEGVTITIDPQTGKIVMVKDVNGILVPVENLPRIAYGVSPGLGH